MKKKKKKKRGTIPDRRSSGRQWIDSKKSPFSLLFCKEEKEEHGRVTPPRAASTTPKRETKQNIKIKWKLKSRLDEKVVVHVAVGA